MGSPLQYQVNNYMHNQHINSDLAVKGFRNTDLSPYNSKFTVLRFSQSRTNSSQSNGQVAALRPFELSPEDFDENVEMQSTQACGAAAAASAEASHEVSAFDLGMSKLASTTSIKPIPVGFGHGNQFISDKVPHQLRYNKPLSENCNPYEDENIFGGGSSNSDLFRP